MVARNPSPSDVAIRPLTPDRWADLAALFGERGACGGCWCMWWRLRRSEFEARKGSANRRAFRRIVASGREPGLLAYAHDKPVGWCAVEPRERYPTLERSRILKPVDDEPVWSITCLFIARPHRRSGLSVELLRAAVRHAAEKGARIVEGYPVDPKSDAMPDAFAWTGTASAFRKAGFVEALRRSPTRPIMRFVVGRGRSGRVGGSGARPRAGTVGPRRCQGSNS